MAVFGGCICLDSSEKQNQQDDSLRPIIRNHMIRKEICYEIVRSWLTWSCRLRGPRICSWQTGDPGRPAVECQAQSKGRRKVSEGQAERTHFPLHCPFVLPRPCMGWMRPTPLKTAIRFAQPTDSNVTLLQKHPREHTLTTRPEHCLTIYHGRCGPVN